MSSPEREGGVSPIRDLAQRLEARNLGGRPSDKVIYGLRGRPRQANATYNDDENDDARAHLTAQQLASATSKPLAASLSVILERTVSPLQQAQRDTQTQLDQLAQRVNALARICGTPLREGTLAQTIEAIAVSCDKRSTRLQEVEGQLSDALAASRQQLAEESNEREGQVALINDALSTIEDKLNVLASSEAVEAVVQAVQVHVDKSMKSMESAFGAHVAEISETVRQLSVRVDADVCKLAQGVDDIRLAHTEADESRDHLQKQTMASFESLGAKLEEATRSLESRLEDATRSLGSLDDLSRRLMEAEARLSSLDELDALSHQLELAESSLMSALETLALEMHNEIDGVGDKANNASKRLVDGLRDMQDQHVSLRAWCSEQLDQRPCLDVVEAKLHVFATSSAKEVEAAVQVHANNTVETMESTFNAYVADIREKLQQLSARVDTVQRTDVCKLARGIATLKAAHTVADQSRNNLEKQTKASFEALESRLEDTTRTLDCVNDFGRRLAAAEASLTSLDELGTWCSDQVAQIRPSLAAESEKMAGKVVAVEKECTRALAEVCITVVLEQCCRSHGLFY